MQGAGACNLLLCSVPTDRCDSDVTMPHVTFSHIQVVFHACSVESEVELSAKRFCLITADLSLQQVISSSARPQIVL